VKVGDLVRFVDTYYHECYGPGLALEYYPSADSFGFRVLFGEEVLHARTEELEVVSESR